ncbi:MAG: hypothetical protein FJ290_21460, partial [Planctomycetes bacterium]|nr:hypothetical protein [Planctomycetota bacterium]
MGETGRQHSAVRLHHHLEASFEQQAPAGRKRCLGQDGRARPHGAEGKVEAKEGLPAEGGERRQKAKGKGQKAKVRGQPPHCRLPSADCRLPTAVCRLPSAVCRLPSALCRLPSAVCRLTALHLTNPPG